MTSKAQKSKTPHDPTITFEVELIESKVRSIGAYVGKILRSCGIKYEKGCRVRKQATCDFKVQKYFKWQQVLVPTDEEDKDYVARIHFLKNTTPQEAKEEASRYMDLDLEDMLCSPTLSVKKSKKRATSKNEASGYTEETLKRTKTITNKKRASNQLSIEPAKSPDNAIPVAVSTSEQALREVFKGLKCLTQNFASLDNIKVVKTDLENAQKKIQELKEANKATLTEANRKLKEAKAEANKKLEKAKADAKARVNTIAWRSIYRAWFANPGMDLIFFGGRG
uniref:Uncharacterized protein n=1 Tax=Cannabis sativa TaxID=3483 RepID=A0A803P9M3_CANSA